MLLYQNHYYGITAINNGHPCRGSDAFESNHMRVKRILHYILEESMMDLEYAALQLFWLFNYYYNNIYIYFNSQTNIQCKPLFGQTKITDYNYFFLYLAQSICCLTYVSGDVFLPIALTSISVFCTRNYSKSLLFS